MLDISYKSILKVALPLMFSSFIQSIVLITDAAFLSRHSMLAFDASGNAGLIYVTIFFALTGMADGIQILIARRIGQDRKTEIKMILHSSFYVLAALVILLFIIAYYFIPLLLPYYSKHKDLADAQSEFIKIRSFALFFAIISLPIQSFLLAIGKTWIVLLSAIIIAISNILFGYWFIFGGGLLPQLGLKGAAIAACLAELLGMLFLFTYIFFDKSKNEYLFLSNLKFSSKTIKNILKLGAPLFFQGFIALFTWTVFFSWIEHIGKFELTVSQNIRAIYFLAFVPIIGFATTTKTFISQYVGAQLFDQIPIIQRRIRILTLIAIIIFFHGAIFYPEFLISIINPQEIYIQKSTEILKFIVGSFLIFGITSVLFQTVNGSGNTIASFLIEFISVGIYILASYVLIKIYKLDIYWVWSVEYIYFGTLGLLSFVYLRFFNWKKLKN
jgi:MATE family multidrug resistance protein